MKLGIDIGSISLKTALLDDDSNILEDSYIRHKGNPLPLLIEKIKGYPVDIVVGWTGTGVKRICEFFGTLPINEVIAQGTATSKLRQEIRTIIEIGGSDSKLINLGEDGCIIDFSTNTICAAGCGSFLDQQASRIKLLIEEFSEFALKSEKLPRIAGRCSVFAKTDMIHLQQEAAPIEDIISGFCFAFARNFKSTIGKGKNIIPPVSFQGGVASNNGMIRAFSEVLGIDIIVLERFATMGAIGAALLAKDKIEIRRLEEAKERFTQVVKIKDDFALAYNARGVVRVLTNECDNALIDFLQATNLTPDFADAYANLGTYYILNEAAEGALDAFNKALTINPEFALAYNGRGIAYFGQGEFEKASQDFSIASYLNPTLVVAEINQGFSSVYASQLVALGSMEKKPGTTLEFRQQYNEMLNQQTKAVGGAMIDDYRSKVLIGAISLNPISSAISSVCKATGYVVKDFQDAAMIEQGMNLDDIVRRGTNIQLREEKLKQAINVHSAFPKKQPSSSIPGYFTSIDRPITEIGALASMVDKSIKPIKDLPRTAIIVSQDPFRTNLMQAELNKYGFQAKVVSPEIDVQTEAKRWDADVILGIRGVDDPSKRYYDDITKKIPPPFPPGGPGGGGAVGIPRWNWGKQFVPTYPKGSPGGVSTEELAKAFVDKGNWPVMTSFSLLYTSSLDVKETDDKEKKK